MRAWMLAMLSACSGCGWNAVFVFDTGEVRHEEFSYSIAGHDGIFFPVGSETEGEEANVARRDCDDIQRSPSVASRE